MSCRPANDFSGKHELGCPSTYHYHSVEAERDNYYHYPQKWRSANAEHSHNTSDLMLRFAEELILLLLDKASGALVPVPDRLMQYALVATMLMDLALEDRIDLDLKRLILVDSTPVDDDLLDPFLTLIAAGGQSRDNGMVDQPHGGADAHQRDAEPRSRPFGQAGHSGAG